jgi:hypothetical protein
MITVIETHAFLRSTANILSDEERTKFIEWIATQPLAGDLIVGSGGLRKVRWSRTGMGKSGGARVITYYVANDHEIWLLVGYAKAKFDNLSTHFLNALKKEIDDVKNKSH